MADFTRYEYDEQVQRMTQLLADAPGWGDGYDSSMGQTLIQLMADVTDHLHFMLMRRTIENYIISAKLRSSVITRASEMGYRMLRARANSGYIRVQLQDSDGNSVVAGSDIRVGSMSQLSSEDNVDYVLAEDLVIKKGDSFGDVLVKQARSVSNTIPIDVDTFVDGNYVVIEDYENIENDLFFVSSGTDVYYDVTKEMTDTSPARRALSFALANDPFYDLRYTVEGMRLIFGDDRFGKKPDDSIRVEYAAVDSLEPLLATGNTFALGSTELFDDDGQSYQYLATNITQIRGGSEAESNESIKNNAIAYNKTNGRAVSNDDYEFWTRQAGIGGIIDARVGGEHELDSLVYNINNVYINYLTLTGISITALEQAALQEYFQAIKVAGDHLVFRPTDLLQAKVNMYPVRSSTLPISNAELYNILYRFLIDYFSLQSGSIGRQFQQSDIIDAMYDLRVSRSGIEYRVIDYVRLDMEAVYPFSNPALTSDVRVRLADGYVPTTGDEFILLIDTIPTVSLPQTGDSYLDILTEMRDQIMSSNDVNASVVINGVTVDNFGYPVEFGLTGETLPYTFVSLESTSPDVVVKRRYFGGSFGRRDLIPLGTDTVIGFTAPSDSSIEIYGRTAIRNGATDTLIATVAAGAVHTFTNTGGTYQSIQLNYLSASTEEIEVLATYPAGAGTQLELKIATLDGFGSFDIDSPASSDLDSVLSFHYKISVPKRTRTITETTRNILDGTLRITQEDGTVIYTTNEDGDFFDTSGNMVDGVVDHRSGAIELPSGLAMGDYLFIYQQDKWQNLSTDSFAAVQLIEPKPTLQSVDFSLSTIELE